MREMDRDRLREIETRDTERQRGVERGREIERYKEIIYKDG